MADIFLLSVNYFFRITAVPKGMNDQYTKEYRQRMRERFLTKVTKTLTKLEIQEMLLFAGQPRGDTKPLSRIRCGHRGTATRRDTAAPRHGVTRRDTA